MYRLIINFKLFLSFMALSGCSLLETYNQTNLVDELGSLTGKVIKVSDQEGPVIVLRYLEENGTVVLNRQVIAADNGEFELPTYPGKYYIAAFIDTNRDGKYQPTEHANYHSEPVIHGNSPHQKTRVKPLTISAEIPKPDTEFKPEDKTLPLWKNIGSVVTLDDSRFSRKHYRDGLWKPVDFLNHAEGGLFFLDEYDPNKIPVLLVHGIDDGPTLWGPIIGSLQQNGFQPWLAYYPSGLRLGMISDYLVEAVSRLQYKHEFQEFYIVAHSMGGIVSRSFVKRYIERHPDNINRVGLFMTVNSPLNGMSSAASGIRYSPIIVPSWRDIASGSEFIQENNNWDWPETIPYHLVASYSAGNSDDGVVPLASQTPWKQQQEAERIYLFDAGHSSLIKEKRFRSLLVDVLNQR